MPTSTLSPCLTLCNPFYWTGGCPRTTPRRLPRHSCWTGSISLVRLIAHWHCACCCLLAVFEAVLGAVFRAVFASPSCSAYRLSYHCFSPCIFFVTYPPIPVPAVDELTAQAMYRVFDDLLSPAVWHILSLPLSNHAESFNVGSRAARTTMLSGGPLCPSSCKPCRLWVGVGMEHGFVLASQAYNRG